MQKEDNGVHEVVVDLRGGDEINLEEGGAAGGIYEGVYGNGEKAVDGRF